MATKKTESGCRVAPAEANLPFPGSALHGSLTLAGHTWTMETLSLRHFSANIEFFAKMLINPNSNHSFELLITEFPPCGCILHLLLNCFALVNLSFLSFFQCNQGPSQRISEGRGKKMFSPSKVSSYIIWNSSVRKTCLFSHIYFLNCLFISLVMIFIPLPSPAC